MRIDIKYVLSEKSTEDGLAHMLGKEVLANLASTEKGSVSTTSIPDGKIMKVSCIVLGKEEFVAATELLKSVMYSETVSLEDLKNAIIEYGKFLQS